MALTRRQSFAYVAGLLGLAVLPTGYIATAPKLEPAGKPLPMNTVLMTDTWNTLMKRTNELVDRENARNGYKQVKR
jgi:hypothetical protein